MRLGVFAQLKQIALDSYDRTVGLVLDHIAVDGSITKAPGSGEVAGRSPVDRGEQGLKRSGVTDGYGIPPGRVLAGANRHDSPYCRQHSQGVGDPTHTAQRSPAPDCHPAVPCRWARRLCSR